MRNSTIDALRQEVSRKAYGFNETTGRWEFDKGIADEVERDFQEHLATLNSVSVVYTKADRIITGDSNIEVKVVADPDMDTGAMNNGREIVFNACVVEELDEQSIVSLHGLNYHEVAHAQFSPRGGGALGKWIVESGYKRAYNVLEDSRIERLISAKYPSTRLFLESAVMTYILNGDTDTWGDAFILTTGRKFIDLEIRQVVADLFTAKYGTGATIKIREIINEFRTLSLSQDEPRYRELIEEFAKVVGKDDEESKFGFAEGGHSERGLMSKGRPASKHEQKELQERADGMEQGGEEESIGDSEEANGDSANDSNGEATANHSGNGNANSDKEGTEELRQKLNKRIEELMQNKTVKNGTNEVRKAIHNNSKQDSSLGNASYETEQVNIANRAIAQRFGAELEQLRIENDPMWRLELPTGRLNVGRTMHSDINDIDRLFDRWETGNDNRDIEAVILVDNSGSMQTVMNRTLESAWVIKRALEMIDSRVTVYRFNDEARLLYSADDKANPSTYRTIRSTGSTNPYGGLLEAERILASSDRSIKMLFIISDGEWDNADANNEIISRINEIEGSLTVSVYLGNLDWYKENWEKERCDEMIGRLVHNAKIFHQVNQPKDLVEVATKVVTSTLVA
jgi:hypothetical protein